MAFLYIIELRDRTHYCGIARNVVKRLSAHAHGMSKSTRKKRPHVIKFIKSFDSMKEARQMEVKIKSQGVTRWWIKNSHRSDNEFPKFFS